jgi:hypothetical protein
LSSLFVGSDSGQAILAKYALPVVPTGQAFTLNLEPESFCRDIDNDLATGKS